MNYPTSDLQFVAQIVRKLNLRDQITAKEEHRLEQIAATGVSSQPMNFSDHTAPIASARAQGATDLTGGG